MDKNVPVKVMFYFLDRRQKDLLLMTNFQTISRALQE